MLWSAKSGTWCLRIQSCGPLSPWGQRYPDCTSIEPRHCWSWSVIVSENSDTWSWPRSWSRLTCCKTWPSSVPIWATCTWTLVKPVSSMTLPTSVPSLPSSGSCASACRTSSSWTILWKGSTGTVHYIDKTKSSFHKFMTALSMELKSFTLLAPMNEVKMRRVKFMKLSISRLWNKPHPTWGSSTFTAYPSSTTLTLKPSARTVSS